MNDKSSTLDSTYLDHKRRQLLKLRDELRKITDAAEREEGEAETESSLQAREYEDDAQRLDMLEKDGSLVARALDRLTRVERALRKIEEGTYGLSDVSGERIPAARLDATPEAVNTLTEQAASERT
jgi:DnaK suppressor protein